MLERKRAAKTYHSVPGDEETGGAGEGIELEEHMGPQESGVTTSGQRETNVDQELDNWDENVADDWDEEEPQQGNENVKASDVKVKALADDVPKSKRDD